MANSQAASQQQLMMQVAQALQQGADPQQVAQQLIQMGYTQQQAAAIIQQVAGQGQMAMGGSTNDTYYQGMSYANGGGVNPYMYTDPYSYMEMGGMIPMAANGMEVPMRPEAQDFPDYGSFKAADDAWMAQYGSDAIQMSDDAMMDYEDPASIAAYNNPALAMVGPQLPTGMSTNVVNTPISKPKLTDFITALGGKTDFKTRAKLAKLAGVPNYKSRPEQDNAVLDYLRIHADAISKNADAYGVHPVVANHIQKVVAATAPQVSTDSIPIVSLPTGDSVLATPGDTSDLGYYNPPPGAFDTTRTNIPTTAKTKQKDPNIALGVANTLGAIGLFSSIPKAYSATENMLSKLGNNLGNVSATELAKLQKEMGKGAVANVKKTSEAFKKLPKKMQSALRADEEAKLAIHEANAEAFLNHVREVENAVKDAAEEEAILAAKGIKGAGKAAPSVMDMIMSKAKAAKSFIGESGEAAKAFMKENKATKFLGEGLKGASEIMKGFKFEEGGYVPNYGMAYGGYAPQAMYGMGMAQGGSIYKEGRDLRDYTKTAAYTPGGWSGYPVDLPPVGWGKASYATGGQMPQWLAQRRFAAAGNEDKMSEYGYADGGMVVGQEMYATPEQLQKLKKGGYQFEIMK